MKSYEMIDNYLQGDLKKLLRQAMEENKHKVLQEIRLRIDKPLCLKFNGQTYFPKLDNEVFIVTKENFVNILEKISRFSLYAFQDEVKNGYLTMKGGHRVGLVGQVVIENEKIKSVKNITSMNIRVSHEIKGNVDKVVNIFEKNFGHTLIISPPAMGKTTLLREIIKKLSDDFNKTVGVVDERREIATGNLGNLTDIIDSCPKHIAMIMLLRSMSPDVIVVDEIGKYEDIKAIEELVNCGVIVVATVHGYGIEDICRKKNFRSLMEDKVFKNYIVMGKAPGCITHIYDSDKNLIGE